MLSQDAHPSHLFNSHEIAPKLNNVPPKVNYELKSNGADDRVMTIGEGESLQMQPLEEEDEMMMPKLQMSPVARGEEIQMFPNVQRLPSTSSTATLPGTHALQSPQTLTLPQEQTGSLTRSTFDSMMQSHFGINRVFNGTQSDQERYLRSASGNSSLIFAPASWTDWNPGADSEIYAHIVNALRAFTETFGGIPSVIEIGFFDVRYAYDHATSSVVLETNAAAAYGGGTLLVYRIASSVAKKLPSARSDTAAAPLPMPSRQETITRIITHELGHGMVEIGLTPTGATASGGSAPDPQLMNDYKTAVGWSSGSAPRLYDIGVPAVRTVIEAGGIPDTRYLITRANWNQPNWVEQPVSAYMTTHPSEDFPEAVMTFVASPELLRSRSPRRFQFILQRTARLAPFLRSIAPAPPEKGDYPATTSSRAVV